MIEEKATELVKNIIEEAGYQLVDVQYINEDNLWYLRIIIDNNQPITVNDCVLVNNLIEPILDENFKILEEAYILDVCSKGVEK